MTNPPKKKGTAAEGEVLRWLVGVTGLTLHRYGPMGVRDVGDIGGLPDVCLEVKSGAPAMAKWLRQLDVEQTNLGARWAFIVWRTPGSTNPHDWLVIGRAHDRFLRPRFPVPGPMVRLPHYTRRCAAFANAGVNYVGANVGFRCDGFMPESTADCHAVAMTGGSFETWLGDTLASRASQQENSP